MLARAGRGGRASAYLPGYTHLQQAQPVLLAHHLMAHAWALARDVDRLLDARRRADVSPLGAGALAGSSLPLDPDGTAADARASPPGSRTRSTHVSDRDFVAESLFVLTLDRASTSRASARRSCCGRPTSSASPGSTTPTPPASSMLPQKKNPDIAELARGKAGRLIGDLTGFLATLKGAAARVQPRPPGGQGAAVRRARHGRLGLGAMAGLYRIVHVPDRSHGRGGRHALRRRHRPRRAAGARRACRSASAHAIVGALVRRSLDDGIPLADLVAAEPLLGERGVALLQPGVPGDSTHDAGRRRPRSRRRRNAVASTGQLERERGRWPLAPRSV